MDTRIDISPFRWCLCLVPRWTLRTA